LYKQVLKVEVGEIENIVWAKKPKKLPVVFTRNEVKAVIRQLSGTKWIMANLLYGAGLRLLECLRLRVQDIEFEYSGGEIIRLSTFNFLTVSIKVCQLR
jgi:integrase